MNRRLFLGFLSSMIGAASVASIAHELPDEIPNTETVSVGYYKDDTFVPVLAIDVNESMLKNNQYIEFPTVTHKCVITHVMICDKRIISLRGPVYLNTNDTLSVSLKLDYYSK